MKEILEVIIKNLVTDTESVSINEIEGQQSIVYEIKVAENDMGKVIGKEGNVAKAIRAIIKAVAAKEHKRVTVEFID